MHRLDVMHAGDTNQMISTETLLSSIPHKTYIQNPANGAIKFAHTKPRNVQQTIVYTLSPASFNMHLSTVVIKSHHHKENSATKSI